MTNPTIATAGTPSLDDNMLRFLDLSQDIMSLVRHENAILLEKGELSFEAYIMRKVDLMNNFEKEARKLLNLMSGSESKMATQNVLIEEIRRVRDALSLNSAYQLQTIRDRAQENLAASLKSSATGETACH